MDHLPHPVVLLILLLVEFFHTRVSWSFTGAWMTASHPRSPGLFLTSYLKIPENFVCLILQDGFWFVHVPFGSMIKFQFLAQFPVDDSPPSRIKSYTSIVLVWYVRLPCDYSFLFCHHKTYKGCPRGVMVKAMDCGIVISEFVLQSRYYVHFRANTLGKGMNPVILSAIG